ncbi:hypothetical protein C1H46_031623 [Malus baccata]|uniref:Uncharacterized protein n=1 Tax=Malus baccata TaxID=106549 RepID=A0A540L8H2_MALBA|nr:hypothetical protein C1H46_031623 [Malus baccata]
MRKQRIFSNCQSVVFFQSKVHLSSNLLEIQLCFILQFPNIQTDLKVLLIQAQEVEDQRGLRFQLHLGPSSSLKDRLLIFWNFNRKGLFGSRENAGK